MLTAATVFAEGMSTIRGRNFRICLIEFARVRPSVPEPITVASEYESILHVCQKRTT